MSFIYDNGNIYLLDHKYTFFRAQIQIHISSGSITDIYFEFNGCFRDFPKESKLVNMT